MRFKKEFGVNSAKLFHIPGLSEYSHTVHYYYVYARGMIFFSQGEGKGILYMELESKANKNFTFGFMPGGFQPPIKMQGRKIIKSINLVRNGKEE